MSDPLNTQRNTLPEPTNEFRGNNNSDGGLFSKIARLWRPPVAPSSEALTATVSRYSMRVIDRLTGRVFSADELVTDENSPVKIALDGKLSDSDVVAGSSTSTYLSNLSGLNKVYDAFMQFDMETDANPVRIGFTGFGDSMVGTNGGINPIFTLELMAKYGCAGIASHPSFGYSWTGAAWTLTGGSSLSSTYGNIPSGKEYIVATDGPVSQTFSPTTTSFGTTSDLVDYRADTDLLKPHLPQGVTKISVFYIKKDNAGSITATLAQSQYADVTETQNADNNSTEELGVIHLTPTDSFADMTLTISAATAAVNMIGAIYWGGSGVVFLASNQGGSTSVEQLAALEVDGTWNPVYQRLLREMNVRFVFNAERTGDTTLENMGATEEIWDAYDDMDLPVILFTEPTRAVENPVPILTINAWLKEKAAERNYAIFDRWSAVDNATEAALGWNKITLTPTVTASATNNDFTYPTGGSTPAAVLANGDEVFFLATSMPGGVVSGKQYFAINCTSLLFQISETKGGTAVDISSAGTSVVAYYSGTVDLHQTPREHRYTLGRFFAETNYFASAMSRRFFRPLTLSGLADQRFTQGMETLLKRTTLLPVLGRDGATDAYLRLQSSTVSTYSNAINDPSNGGFYFPASASLGHCAAVFGRLRTSGAVMDPAYNITFYATGAGFGSGGSMVLTSGHQAYLFFGIAASETDPTSAAGLGRCCGLEFALGQDIGTVGGVPLDTGKIYVRILWSNATTISYSRWIGYSPSGGSENGMALSLTWNATTKRFTLAIGEDVGSYHPRLSVFATSFSENVTVGNYAGGLIRAANYNYGNGAGATPTPGAIGRMSWNMIGCDYGSLSAPYSIR